MTQFIFAAENMIFTVAIAVMLIIGIIEAVAILFGMGASSAFDSMMPEMHMDSPDAGEGFFGDSVESLLGWLHVGKVPVLMLLVIALANFGTVGLVLQAFLIKLTGRFFSGWILCIPVFIISLFLTRFWGGILYRIMPGDETRAVCAESLIGTVAVITLGTARKGSPAEAKSVDSHGQTHYFLVEPDSNDEEFSKGDEVLIISMHGHVYRAVFNHDSFFSNPNKTE